MKITIIAPIILLLVLGITACQPKKQEQKIAAQGSPVNKSLTQLLDSLEYCYVENVTDTELLRSYEKPYPEFQEDSIVYSNAVNSFFRSDYAVIDQLLLFEGDTVRCNWVYAINPRSSSIRKWEFNFTREQGAIVLIHDYLLHFCTERKGISADPSSIEYIITSITMYELKTWLKKNEGLSIKLLCEKFKQELSPFK